MVPSLLRSRKSYKSCFNPSVVSIGPYHDGKSEYRAFEKLKSPIAQKLCRLNLISVERLYEDVANVGKSARECYEKGWTDGYDDEFFNRMMFLDACFVAHFLLIGLIQPVMHDFENLVTFFGKSKSNFRESNIQESYRSVTDLKSAGIYFKPSQTGSCTDVKFISRHIFGTLTIPPIKVDHLTKPLLLNLAAYEMCPHGPSEFRITSYICLMDSLIDHADDVKELRKKRILINKLGSDEHLARLFNEIANDLEPDPRAYADVRLKIDKHCKYKGHIWMAEWTRKNFSSPWALLAFLGAILVLALTLAQTYFTAYPR
ncbi:Hypothetical predicted protein [Olea europaea subsp. europaea]|uniref:Uncharacterized protein n=1 Tax=Olea europaea subsp. europaea TaxID=158383 RepID=A0A8S0PWB9_OLEEU|nr:Hypothetical predicted protein [Olea europaea subsp. europaea]